MKKLAASLLLSLLAVAAVASLMTPSAKAQTETLIFQASLLAANEVPPVAVAPSEQTAIGFATVTLTVTRSGGNITAASSRFDASLNGLASPIILAHIHQGASNVNGPIVVDSGISPAAPINPVSGAAGFTRTNLATTPAIAQAIISNPAGFYFNVHTVLSPGGVARGQLVLQQQPAPGIAAPTLSEWGAILMTLLIIAACTFFMIGRKSAIAGDSPVALAGSQPAVDWKLLAKVTLYVEAAIALALVALRAGTLDAIGAMASGLLVAFIAHLFIANARRR
jgi:CHRD domain